MQHDRGHRLVPAAPRREELRSGRGPRGALARSALRPWARRLSKCLALRRSHVEPSRAIRRPELGTLNIGAEAEIAGFPVAPTREARSDLNALFLSDLAKLSGTETVSADPNGSPPETMVS